MSLTVDVNKELLKHCVENSTSVSGVLRMLGARCAGWSHKRLSNTIKELGISTKHFKNRNDNAAPQIRRTAENILVLRTSGERQKSIFLRRALIESNVPYKCAGCGIGKYYNNAFIMLQIDHINGNWLDDRLENLRFMCPNCHSQTIGWCRKGEFASYSRKLIGLFSKEELKEIRNNAAQKAKETAINNPRKYAKRNTREQKEKEQVFCKVCGKVIGVSGKFYCSQDCAHKDRKKFNPSKEALQSLIEQYPMTTIGKMFGVSDNAVKKRAKSLGIEIPKRLGFWAKVRRKKLPKVKKLF